MTDKKSYMGSRKEKKNWNLHLSLPTSNFDDIK
jgi:hypothetical protein